MCPAGPGSEPSRRPGERASLPKRAGGLLPIPREDPGPDSWAPQGGGERNPEAAAEAGDMEPSLCRHLEHSADPAQLLFTAPAGVGWGGLYVLCSQLGRRAQAAWPGGWLLLSHPTGHASPGPGRGSALYRSVLRAAGGQSAARFAIPSAGRPGGDRGGAAGAALERKRHVVTTRRAGGQFGAAPPPVTWCEHRRDRPQGGDGLLGLHDQNVPSWPQPRTGLSHTHESRRDPLSCLWRAPPHLPLRLGANMVLHKH